ncbi:DUF134 domain-containing protein [bacterium]|nr:DUF134 domain-containing protein [bacterium]
MPRPKKCRRIAEHTGVRYFKPHGIPMRFLEHVSLTLDEMEAMRLADLEGLSQQEGAERMNISRATFGRIVASARGKTAEALYTGLAIKIEGGQIEFHGGGPCRHGRGHQHGRRGFAGRMPGEMHHE